MKRLNVASLLICLVLAACAATPTQSAAPPTTTAVATAQPPTLSDVSSKLDNAIAIATAGNDAAGVACWTNVKSWVATLPMSAPSVSTIGDLPEATGLSGAFETTRIKVQLEQARISAAKAHIAALNAVLINGLPVAVTNACAPLVVDAGVLQAKILGVLALVPQTGIVLPGVAALRALH